jgi:hypothetical protein
LLEWEKQFRVRHPSRVFNYHEGLNVTRINDNVTMPMVDVGLSNFVQIDDTVRRVINETYGVKSRVCLDEIEWQDNSDFVSIVL